jgi:hypothetical protein
MEHNWTKFADTETNIRSTGLSGLVGSCAQWTVSLILFSKNSPTPVGLEPTASEYPSTN